MLNIRMQAWSFMKYSFWIKCWLCNTFCNILNGRLLCLIRLCLESLSKLCRSSFLYAAPLLEEGDSLDSVSGRRSSLSIGATTQRGHRPQAGDTAASLQSSAERSFDESLTRARDHEAPASVNSFRSSIRSQQSHQFPHETSRAACMPSHAWPGSAERDDCYHDDHATQNNLQSR